MWKNVKDPAYGAVGDGTTDDYPAFVACRDDLYASGGGVLYAPTGKYRLGQQLDLNPRRIMCLGDGPQNTFLMPTLVSGQTAITFGWPSNLTGPGLGPYTAMEKMSIIGQIGPNQPDAVSITSPTGHAYSLTFRDISFEGFNKQVSVKRNAYLLNFDRVFFNSPNQYGFCIDSDADGTGENLSFRGCTFSGGPGDGFYVNFGGASLHFESCSFDYVQRAGRVRAGCVSISASHFESDKTGMEYILFDRSGGNLPPMLRLTDCDFYLRNDWNYETVIRCAGPGGDNGLRVNNAYIIHQNNTPGYFIRDDGVNWQSSIGVTGMWYARQTAPKMKLRKRDGTEVVLMDNAIISTY